MSDPWQDAATRFRHAWYDERKRNRALERVAEAARALIRDFGGLPRHDWLHKTLQMLDTVPPTQDAEIRLNDDNNIDEVCVQGLDHFHLEQMDDGVYWIGLSRGEEMLHINLHAVKKRRLDVRVNDEGFESVVTKGSTTVCGYDLGDYPARHCALPPGHEGPHADKREAQHVE